MSLSGGEARNDAAGLISAQKTFEICTTGNNFIIYWSKNKSTTSAVNLYNSEDSLLFSSFVLCFNSSIAELG